VIVLRVLSFAAGFALVVATLGSAVRTVILPRGVPAQIARTVFIGLRWVFELRTGRVPSYEKRDRVLAYYGPLGMLALLATWLILVFWGFALMFWGLNGGSLYDAMVLSGSSLLTLGFATHDGLANIALTLTEAAIGLVLLALLITYLPTVYAAFSRRELAVTALEVRAGSPPSGVEMIARYWILENVARLSTVWEQWEEWFADIEETHTSFSALVFFRSPQPDHSWVTAAGAVLDGAALTTSTLDLPRDVQADICIRAGYLALRRIAGFFRIPYDPNPSPEDPISVTRGEFDEAYDRLAEVGVPLRADRDQAWRDFSGWRVNYDRVLVALATFTDAPVAPWSSDRAFIVNYRRPRYGRRLRRAVATAETATPVDGSPGVSMRDRFKYDRQRRGKPNSS
jgi:hypothetical protein